MHLKHIYRPRKHTDTHWQSTTKGVLADKKPVIWAKNCIPIHKGTDITHNITRECFTCDCDAIPPLEERGWTHNSQKLLFLLILHKLLPKVPAEFIC